MLIKIDIDTVLLLINYEYLSSGFLWGGLVQGRVRVPPFFEFFTIGMESTKVSNAEPANQRFFFFTERFLLIKIDIYRTIVNQLLLY
jgi:hypothetical protein